MNNRIGTIVVSFLIVVLFLISTMATCIGVSEDEPVADDNTGFGWHYLTRDEMEDMKAKVGVREPGRNYNVIVDGNPTGLAPPTAQTWEDMVGTLKIVDRVEPAGNGGEVPRASVDLSAEPYFPVVGNQLLGSCAAWAMTYYSYGYLEAKDNNWTGASTGNPNNLMSPVWTYNRVNGGTDSGSWMWDNAYILRDWGGTTWANLPSTGNPVVWGNESAHREAPLHRAYDAYQMSYSPTNTVNDVKTLLNGGIPITFTLDAGEYGAGFADGNYIISSMEYDSVGMNHANTIVGFDDGVVDDFEIGAFKVVNSWGDWWGDEGYYWLTYQAFEEIGGIGQLYPTYIEDRIDYVPKMLGVWHFNTAPTRDAFFVDLGVGSYGSPLETKSLNYDIDNNNAHRFPTFMCLDITEFTDEYELGTEDFYLDIGLTDIAGTISSFKVEKYENNYIVGIATQATAQSPDTPLTTPGYVTNTLDYYSLISIKEAIDADMLDFNTSGVAGWVGVDHHSYYDSDSMQSGDVGDGELTNLETDVEGLDTLSFYWKVSSESFDYLKFYIDDIEQSSISGNVDWHQEKHTISAGPHTLKWEYSKNGATSTGEDAGWVDLINMENLTKPSVWLSSPDGGEILGGGGTWPITWTVYPGSYPLIPLPITLEYSTTGAGGPWNPLASNQVDDGAYNWNPVPTIDTTNCFVRVTVEDSMGNLATDTSNSSFTIDSTAPEPAANAHAELTGSNDVTIYWNPSPSPDVDHYEVWYRANTGWDPNGDGYVFRADAGLSTNYVDVNTGKNSGADYWWQIRTYDVVDHETRTIQQAAKVGSVQNAVVSNWHLCGSGLVHDYSLANVLQGFGLPGNYRCVRTYDGQTDTWKTSINGHPHTPLTQITDVEGFWMYISATTRFAAAGYIDDKVIDLYEGWNLVAYPFATNLMTSGDIMTHLAANCPNYDGMMIAGDPFIYPMQLRFPDGTETIQNSFGFWVKVTADTTWTVINY